ncbi:hypothetical protein [Sulfitobacter sp. EhC04]|uniref:hypothetical protein n=1 Tax=Sulfitobacter sp. EhC04 TaxID=1849168 RepID=UPI0010FEFB0D|nr:hypothetical protein [Sulfitobacter sp. EhC04]
MRSMTCIGFNCANPGGDATDLYTLSLESTRPDLLFVDREEGQSPFFSEHDWRIVINNDDSEPIQVNRFAIQDEETGLIPFTLMGNAPVNSLFVDANGDIGLGTSIPQADLHIIESDFVRIQLGVTGSTPKSWEMTGSGQLFAISYDSAALPFILFDGAPTASFTVDPAGQVGLGILSPEEKLHIQTNTPNTDAFALFDANGAGSDAAFRLRQNGVTPTTWEFRNQQDSGRLNVGLAGGNTPLKIDNAANNNLLRLGRNGKPDEVVVTGTLVVNNTDMNVPDYVFAPGYELPTLAEIDAFIADNGHLPGVPSATEVAETGLDMTQMQLAQLEKIEELTLHVIDLGKANAEQRDRIAQLEGMVAALLADH